MPKKLTKTQEKLVPFLQTRSNVAEIAAHALVNSVDLYKSARLLFDKKHYPLAQSIAITTREEVGKFVFASTYLMGYISVERLAVILTSHPEKQMVGQLLIRFQPYVEEHMRELQELSDDPTVADLEAALKAISNRIEALAPETWKALEASAEQWLSELEMVRNRRDELRRQNGLYVSPTLKKGTFSIKFPRMILREQAEAELLALKPFLGWADSEQGSDGEDQDVSEHKDQVTQLAEVFDRLTQAECVGSSPGD